MIEQGVRRIYRRVAQAGFAPLTAQEIEQILAQVEPPTALPGVKRPAPDRAMQERQAVSAMSQAFQSQGQSPPGAASALKGMR